MKIRDRGMLLIGVPLITQVALLSALLIVLSQAEYETRKANQAKDTMISVNLYLHHMYSSLYRFIRYSMKGDVSDKQTFDVALEQAENDLKNLKQLGIVDGVKLPWVDSMMDKHNFLLKALHDLEARVKTWTTPWSFIRDRPFFDRVNDSISTWYQEDFLANSNTTFADTSPGQEQSRKMVLLLIYAGFAINVTVAIGMGILFGRDISQRFAVLTENAARAGRQEEILPPLNGSDEIAWLDRIFREMLISIKEVEQTEKQMIMTLGADLKEPLDSALIDLQRISAGDKTVPEAVAEKTKVCAAELERVSHIIADFSDQSSIESGIMPLQYRKFAVAQAITRAVSAMQAQAAKRSITLAATVPDKLEVVADRSRFIQVVVNLLSNAIKFSPDSSTVAIKASLESQMLEIHIIDKGRGVPAEKTDSIFEKFEQVQQEDASVKEGTGLGLPICKSIVERHGGTIGATSKENDGSDFWFRIPISQKAGSETPIQTQDAKVSFSDTQSSA